MRNKLRIKLSHLLIAVFVSICSFAQTGNSFEFTLVTPPFPNEVPNQAIYIRFPDVPIWGYLEVTITSTFSHELSTGKITKRYEIGHNTSSLGGYFNQKTEVPAVFGSIASQWYIGDFDHATNSIPIYHLVNTQNSLFIKIEGLLYNSDYVDAIKTGTTISALQTISAPGSRHYMSIMQDRVGIGTATPDSALAVNGTIHSKEVKVDTNNWPDFVFKKEYNLPTLEEVEKHISEKGHLENIPNEEEVLKNGINLGEMNAKLLQKIEELTLYVIDLNKKVNDLQTKKEKLENQNNVLSKKVLSLKAK